ncbi:BON domain-containing protein [bacterium]|nr:BON domain-containing protein [bacterium]
MLSKYDRNIEDIERARMEERFWSPRFAEPGFVQSNLYGEPYWLSQLRQLQQPVQQIQQNPYMQQLSPYPTFQLNPQIPQFHPTFHPALPNAQSYWGQPYEGVAQQSQPVRFASRAFGRPPRNYKRSDELIRDEICKRLAMTPDLDATDLEVVVRDGEVTLRGTVDDRFAKRLVEDITECTFGVRDLLNEIRGGTRFHEPELTGATKGKEK